MSTNLAAFFYLISSICFIMALRGLSSPDSARRGNLLGMVGMAIAIATTLAVPGVLSYGLIAIAVLIGGSIGTVIALRIQMTSLPLSALRQFSLLPPHFTRRPLTELVSRDRSSWRV
jgi:NAD(P) transhydrogenase subunit beta